MLAAAAVCPHPPLLVPELAAGAAAELDDLRAACRRAVAALGGAGLDELVVVGADETLGPAPAGAVGRLAPYGVDVTVGQGDRTGPALPLSLTIGRWLLDQALAEAGPGAPGPAAEPDPPAAPFPPTVLFGVPADAAPDRCAALGALLAARAPRVGLLVMGDGSARRVPKGPGYLDERAEPFDDAVAAALRAGDPAALLALDPALADELLVGGRAAWQVLAGAAAPAGDVPDRAWTAEVGFAAAPYGVGYLVATWR